jgi:hypothetical protein
MFPITHSLRISNSLDRSQLIELTPPFERTTNPTSRPQKAWVTLWFSCLLPRDLELGPSLVARQEQFARKVFPAESSADCAPSSDMHAPLACRTCMVVAQKDEAL